MIGRVDKVRRIFEKIVKKLKLKSHDPKKHNIEHFQINLPKHRSCDYFFCNFLKYYPESIDPSGYLVFYEIFVARTFLVERHLDYVLEVLLVDG